MRMDLHVHTTRHSGGCSVLAPQKALEAARAAGLDGIVLAEHLGTWNRAELEALEHGGLKVFAAREVNKGDLHVLVFGLAEPLPKTPDAVSLARAVHELGGAAVLAHPFRWGDWHRRPAQELAPVWSAFHAVEVFNGNMLLRECQAAAKMAQTLGLPLAGGSDAHQAQEVGRCLTEFPGPIDTLEQLTQALRQGRCQGWLDQTRPWD